MLRKDQIISDVYYSAERFQSINHEPTVKQMSHEMHCKLRKEYSLKNQLFSRIPISVHCHQIPLVTQYNNVLEVHTIYNQSSNYSHKHFTGKILTAEHVGRVIMDTSTCGIFIKLFNLNLPKVEDINMFY